MYEGVDEFPDFSESTYNVGEAELVAIATNKLIAEMGIPMKEIGIICPHWAQVGYVRYHLQEINSDYK